MTDLLERDFQLQVTDLAEALGYEWAHFRPAKTSHGWRTPVAGTLGAGWPDLVLASPRRRRVVLAELKSATGLVSSDQERVHDVLRRAGMDVRLWRPDDLATIAQVLA